MLISGYDTMGSRKDDSITRDSMRDSVRDSVLMEFVIPEDNSVAVSSPPPVITPPCQDTGGVEVMMESVTAPLAVSEDVDDVVDDTDAGVDVTAVDEMEYTQLDAEIESLQAELHKLNATTNPPVVEEILVDEKANGICHAPAPDLQHQAVKRRCSPIKALLVCLGGALFTTFMCVVMAVLLFELETDKLSTIQNHQSIRQFRHHYYNAVRQFVLTNAAKILPK